MKRISALAILIAAAAPALADDYPFSGYYSAVDESVSAADAQLMCAFSFFRQDKSGDFVNLIIDLPAFKADGTVRFDEEGGGVCKLSAGRLEDCTVTAALDREEVGNQFYSVLTDFTDSGVKVAGFEEVRNAQSWTLLGNPEPDYYSRYERCVGFDDATLKPFLSGKKSTATPEESDALNAPPEDDMRPVMEKILTIVRGSKL